VTGFGAYPTYLSLDFGRLVFPRVEHGSFAGGLLTLGPALRIDPTVGAGAQVSAAYCLFFLELGLRSIFIAHGAGDGQIEATMGLGLL
jgi:hypothetical protein